MKLAKIVAGVLFLVFCVGANGAERKYILTPRPQAPKIYRSVTGSWMAIRSTSLAISGSTQRPVSHR
jgi:hypothetical protein